MRFFILFTSLMMTTWFVHAQIGQSHLVHGGQWLPDYYENMHTGLKPLLRDSSKLQSMAPLPPVSWQQKLWHKVKYDDLLSLDTGFFKLRANLLINYWQGREQEFDATYSQNTRAVNIFGAVGQKLSFYTAFYENQAFYPDYVNQYIHKTLVVPGQGASKFFREVGHDFSRSEGHVDFYPYTWLSISAGHGKHFVGFGYRSLLLSDHSFVYPYIRLDFNWKNWQLTSLKTRFEQFAHKYYAHHYTRTGSFNYLSYKPFNFLEMGFFEAMLWETRRSSNTPGHTLEKWSPLPFYNPLRYGLGGTNNVLLGLNAQAKILNYAAFYGQIAADELPTTGSSNQPLYAWQAGFKIFDLLGRKTENLHADVLLEMNAAAPATYTQTDSLYAYLHYNEALAHPSGANFIEKVMRSNLQWHDFALSVHLSQINQSMDSTGFYAGSNLLRQRLPNTDLSEQIAAQNVQKTNYRQIRFSYLINRKSRLWLFVSYQKRRVISPVSTNTNQWITFGLQNRLNNYYFDF